jgi:hypothetical protein
MTVVPPRDVAPPVPWIVVLPPVPLATTVVVLGADPPVPETVVVEAPAAPPMLRVSCPASGAGVVMDRPSVFDEQPMIQIAERMIFFIVFPPLFLYPSGGPYFYLYTSQRGI